MELTYLQNIIKNTSILEVFDYIDGPKFYSCTSPSGQLFVVLWIGADENDSRWLYVEVSLDRYTALKTGQIDIRDAFLQAENNYVLETVIDAASSELAIQEIAAQKIPLEVLPPIGDSLDFQVSMLPMKIVTTIDAAKRSLRRVVDIAFEKKKGMSRMAVTSLANALLSLQALVDALGTDQSEHVRRVSAGVKGTTRLEVGGLFAGSFGVRLESSNDELFDEERHSAPLMRFSSLLNESTSRASLIAEIGSLNILSRARYKKFLEVLDSERLSISAEWASPTGRNGQSTLNRNQLKQALYIIDSDVNTSTDTVKLSGQLVGIDVEKEIFDFISGDGESYKGKITLGLLGGQFHVPSKVTVTIKEEFTINNLTGKEQWQRTLLECEEEG